MFERILTEEGFNKVYPILAQSFPETEVRSKEDQLALIENEKYHLYAIEDEDGTVGGVIAAWELADDFLYIEHCDIAGKAKPWIRRKDAGFIFALEGKKCGAGG